MLAQHYLTAWACSPTPPPPRLQRSLGTMKVGPAVAGGLVVVALLLLVYTSRVGQGDPGELMDERAADGATSAQALRREGSAFPRSDGPASDAGQRGGKRVSIATVP